MQIKPGFDSFKELEKHYICTDDRGVKYSLVHFVGEKTTSFRVYEKETKITDAWVVIADTVDTHSNGFTGRQNNLFWRDKAKPLMVVEIEGKKFEEVEDGTHSMFWELIPSKTPGVLVFADYGLKTKFLPVKEVDGKTK